MLSGLDQLLIPIEFDPPDHRKYRSMMNPYFTREALEIHRPVMEKAVDTVIDAIIDLGRSDLVPWAFRMMAPIWCVVMGAPADRAEDYIRMMFAFTHQYDPAIRFQTARDMLSTMQGLYSECKEQGGTGLISAFINTSIDGRLPTESECGGFILFMFLAGIDTMGSTTAWLLRHLALHPDERRILIDHPERRSAFLEEGFRRYAVVSTNRFVKADIEVRGVLLKKGDNVLISTPFACMDPSRFDTPLRFDMERRTRHLAFGAGAHFCIGAQLSRMQLPIMLDRWLSRIPDFGIEPGARLSAHFGDVMALNSLPLVWPRG
jgi:cytochrome P450